MNVYKETVGSEHKVDTKAESILTHKPIPTFF